MGIALRNILTLVLWTWLSSVTAGLAIEQLMNSMKLVIPFHFMEKLCFCYWQEVHVNQYDWSGSTLIFYDKMDFLLVLENGFLHEIKCDGITGFTDFMRIHFWRENAANRSWLDL